MSRFDDIRDKLWPNGSRPNVWAVLDGARSPQVYSSILSSHNLNACLYAGQLSPALERCAPHLVQLEYEDKVLTRRLFEGEWGKSWGIVLRCDSSLDRIRRHLRRLLVVQDPKGRRLVFRYYDPRVARVYLPTCVRDEVAEFFGPIERFWMESEDANRLISFANRNGQVAREEIGV